MAGYTILDILDKLIVIEEKGYKMYDTIYLREDIDEKIKLVAKILAAQELKHIQLYKRIKKTTEEGELPSIDFDIYDQASQLLSNFLHPVLLDVENIKELLRFSLDYEKQNLALIITIQGLLVRGLDGSNSVTYNVLGEIIEEQQKHIQNIEGFIR
ncbi:MAG TPA: hypothetical protein GXZ90_09325 [Clostridiales bacterium]|nr:hypothetical protein [Clostridiales bacterium]